MEKRAGSFQPGGNGRELRRSGTAAVKRERRAANSDGTAEDSGGKITGIAAVFYRDGDATTEYWLWSTMVERIMPGAFDRAIKEAHDARGLYNHESSQLLGRVSAGTCLLSVTTEGLAYEIPVDPADPDHQRVVAKLDRGDVTGSSFAFIARETVWREVTNADGSYYYVREIYDVDLYDVGPVTWPAYEGTCAECCSADGERASESMPAEIRGLITERERYLRKADDEAVQMRLRRLAVG